MNWPIHHLVIRFDGAFRHSEKEANKVSKGFKEGFNVIVEVDMTDKHSWLDYSLEILNEINLLMNHLREYHYLKDTN